MRPNANTVLMTGSISGVGLELAKLLIGGSNTVIICGRNESHLDAARVTVPGVMTIPADVADPPGRQSLANEVTDRFGGLNVLINDAELVPVCDLTKADHLQELETAIAVNLVAPVALASLLLPTLRRQPAATIINFTAGHRFPPDPGTAAYAATKMALHVMTKALRVQLRNSNVQVVEVMPPPIDTAMSGDAESAALTIIRGLIRNRHQIAIGASLWSRLAGGLAGMLAR